MSSEVKICNLALGWLGGNLITSLGDNTTEAQLCNANYALLRDAVLEEGKWTFATRRYKMLPDPNEPVYGYSRKFRLNPSVLVVIEARDDNANSRGSISTTAESANGSSNLDWRREEEFIVCNSAVVYSKCIVQITDPKRFTQTFTQALAYRIASELAMPLTESRTKMESMEAKYQSRIDMALAVDGMQGKSDRVRSKSNIIKRR